MNDLEQIPRRNIFTLKQEIQNKHPQKMRTEYNYSVRIFATYDHNIVTPYCHIKMQY